MFSDVQGLNEAKDYGDGKNRKLTLVSPGRSTRVKLRT
jgi:hypothetical protein